MPMEFDKNIHHEDLRKKFSEDFTSSYDSEESEPASTFENGKHMLVEY